MIKDIKPKLHGTDIRLLIDRYMSGDTTNEEEAMLRTWFRLAGDDIPEEWRPMKALFGFVDEEREMPHRRNTLLIALHRPRIWIASAVAAAAIAIVMLVPSMNKAFAPEPQNYAVIDGKVYTNQEVINEQVDEALQTVSAENDDPFSALDLMQ